MDLNQRKEKFSRAYVSALCATVGCSISQWDVDDDSVDLTLKKRGLDGPIRTPHLDIQLKATARAALTEERVPFPLKTKNFDDLRAESHYPRILVLVTLPGDEVLDWLDETDAERLTMVARGYWTSLAEIEASANTTSTTVHFPATRRFCADALTELLRRISHQLPLVES
jgi:Domain of unknown function (DUF4365)